MTTAEIKIGDGATQSVGSDRYPYTVVKILSPRRMVVQQDNAVRTDKNGLSESQTYEYSPNPNATEVVITLRSNGRWYQLGQSTKSGAFYIGRRSMYQDPSF
jgi:hypothetical protein